MSCLSDCGVPASAHAQAQRGRVQWKRHPKLPKLRVLRGFLSLAKGKVPSSISFRPEKKGTDELKILPA